MNLIEIKCPSCKAQLNVNDDRKMLFCEYCGTRIFLDDGIVRTEHTENINVSNTSTHVDEAKIKEIEFKREVYNQKLELKNKKKESVKRLGLIVLFVMIILIVCLFFVYRSIELNRFNEEQKLINRMNQQIESGMINVGYDSRHFIDDNYKTVKTTLEALGFKNIVIIDANDRDLGDKIFGYNPRGAVKSISIKGIESFSKYDCFDKNDQIIITHH